MGNLSREFRKRQGDMVSSLDDIINSFKKLCVR